MRREVHRMTGADLFAIYRTMLAVVFGSYAILRTVSFVWTWHAGTLQAGRSEALFRRYLYASVLRLRFRRFWPLLVQILLLVLILVYVLGLIARRSHSAYAGPDAVTTKPTTDGSNEAVPP
jgi:hypothetical protein